MAELVHTLRAVVFGDCLEEAKPTNVMSLVSNFSVEREEAERALPFLNLDQ